MPRTPLSALTTLRIGGPATAVVEAHSAQAVVEAVAACDARREPVLVLGGGSNVVVADSGFPGTLVVIRSRGRAVDRDGDTVRLSLSAGEVWDDVVAECVRNGWAGIEAMSGIPGSVGAAPIQNIGAYGQEVAPVVEQITVYDRANGETVTLQPQDCRFGYRSSVFKQDPERYVVLGVVLRLEQSVTSLPVAYPELARSLGIEVGESAPLAAVRSAVLGLRRSKGMVLDEADHDTWSAGSFFTNPILSLEESAALPAEAPRFATADGRVKTSAAWLIDRAGFGKGYCVRPDSGAAVSMKHALALTNRGHATTADVVELARAVRAGVRETFGVTLENEPVLIGVSLDA